jgi:hypothetical protein
MKRQKVTPDQLILHLAVRSFGRDLRITNPGSLGNSTMVACRM